MFLALIIGTFEAKLNLGVTCEDWAIWTVRVPIATSKKGDYGNKYYEIQELTIQII